METTVRKVRQQLGFGQQEFADCLSIHRSYLAMAEINRRTLPDHALLLLARLAEVLEKAPLPDLQDTTGETIAPEEMEAQIASEERALARMQDQLAQHQAYKQESIRQTMRLQNILTRQNEDPELREIFLSAHRQWEDQLQKTTPQKWQKMEKRIIEKRAWIDHLKDQYSRLSQIGKKSR